MGRKFTPESPSPFYPPRARWYSAFFYLGNAVRRRLALDRLTLPREILVSGLVMGFLVPGLAVVLRGPRIWGRAAMMASALLAMFYIVWLGYPAGNFAFGLLLSVHSTGFVYYCNPLLAREPFHSRIGFTILVLLGMMLLLYWPARSFVQNHFFTPLRMHGQVVVVQRFLPKRAVQRGDWVAYSPDENDVGENYHGGTVWLRSGLCFAPVLAVAGDTVTFSTNGFAINDGTNWLTLLRGQLASTWNPQTIAFEKTVTTKHLKLTALSGFGTDESTALAELAVLYAGPKLPENAGKVEYHRVRTASMDIDAGDGPVKPVKMRQ